MIFYKKLKSNTVTIKDILAVETFKDEIRVMEKVDTPRTFRVLPLPVIIRTKQYLAKLLQHIKADMWHNQIAIGYNPYKHAGQMYKQLKSMYMVFDVDVKNWDGTVLAQVQQMVNDVVIEFYSGKNKRGLRLLLNSVINGYVMVGDALYQTTHSMPSGSWITALFNSFYNKVLSAMSYSRACRVDGITPNLDEFKMNVDWAMGDDKQCGATVNTYKQFNAIRFKEACDEWKIVVTNGDKTPITAASTSLSNVSFLKRTYKYNSDLDRMVAVLSYDTILNTIQWYDSKSDYFAAMQGKLLSMSVECYLHSETLWASLYNKFYKTDNGKIFNYFSVEEIIDILNSENGFEVVNELRGKTYTY